MKLELDNSKEFDRIPVPLIHLIFNQISDIKALIWCRAVSKRCNSLVPLADSLRRLLHCLTQIHHQIPSPLRFPEQASSDPTRSQNSPAQILHKFKKIRNLQIEIRSGNLRIEKGTTIRWKT